MVGRLPVVLIAATLGIGALGLGGAAAQTTQARFVTVELQAEQSVAEFPPV